MRAKGVRRESLRRKLLFSHLSVAMIGVVVIVLVFFLCNWLKSHIFRLSYMRAPSALTAASLSNAVQTTLADLRGWIALGYPSFKLRRQRTWSNEIKPQMQKLRLLSARWSNRKDLEAFERSRVLLADLEESQWWMEEMAHAPGKLPAKWYFKENNQPIPDSIDQLIGAMITLEHPLPINTDRKALLTRMTRFRNAMTRCHLEMGRYLEEGGREPLAATRRFLAVATRTLHEMERQKPNFSEDQHRLFRVLKNETAAYRIHAAETARLRARDDWDLVRYWMKREAVPLAEEASSLLVGMAGNQAAYLQSEAPSISANTDRVFQLLILIILAMILFICLFSLYLSRRISKPIEKLTVATRLLSQGELKEDLQVERGDELGLLTADFNAMRRAIVQSRRRLTDKQEQLHKSLDDKEILFHELNHRVKNNLQVISSLLDLQSLSVSDPAAAAMFQEGRDRIHGIALIHETLYKSKHRTRVNLPEYIHRLAGSLFASYGVAKSRIHFQTRMDDLTLELDQAIPCGLILNELMSNSLKYAFPAKRTGSLLISAKRDEGGPLTLTVTDDGIGMPPGFNPDQITTMGLTIVETLVRQLEGTINWPSSSQARFILQFTPLSAR